ncbi:MAG: PIN domain-containing protein [Lentimonas sp.]
MKTYLLDTNVILRFLTGESEAQAQRAKLLFEQCEAGVFSIRILPLVIAEVVFVLTGKYYQMERAEVAKALILFLENPSFDVADRDSLIRGLQIFQQHNIDYADAYLAAEAQINDCGIASFDQNFQKIPDLDLHKL